MNLHLRRRDAALSEELDPAASLAALPPFEKMAHILVDHLEGVLNDCRIEVRRGVVEAINGNIKTLLRRRRDYKTGPDSSPSGSRLKGPPGRFSLRADFSLMLCAFCR